MCYMYSNKVTVIIIMLFGCVNLDHFKLFLLTVDTFCFALNEMEEKRFYFLTPLDF